MTGRSGAAVKEWRVRNRYSQADLAEELEVARQTIIKWESSAQIDRVVELALRALDGNPQVQNLHSRKSEQRNS